MMKMMLLMRSKNWLLRILKIPWVRVPIIILNLFQLNQISKRLFHKYASKRSRLSKIWSRAWVHKSSKYSTTLNLIVSIKVDVECFSKWSKRQWIALLRIRNAHSFSVLFTVCFQLSPLWWIISSEIIYVKRLLKYLIPVQLKWL